MDHHVSHQQFLKGRNLEHVFRIQPHGGMFGTTSPDFQFAHYAKEKLGVDPSKLKVAIIHEDGPYGSGVAGGNEGRIKKTWLQNSVERGIAIHLGPDLSSLVTKFKRKRPDVIFHTERSRHHFFLRQSRELGLKWKALIGHGAGYGVPDKLYEAFGNDANYIFNVDPVSIWLIDLKTLAPGLGKLQKWLVASIKKPSRKLRHSQHVGMGASNTYTFFDEVLASYQKIWRYNF